MSAGSVSLQRVLRAPPARVYRAFTEPAAMAKWLPPHGYTCTVQHMDVRVGGTYRMSFASLATGHGHSFGGEYLELAAGESLRYTAVFEDANLPGRMTTQVRLAPVFCGTGLTVVQDGIPAAIPLAACQLGWQESLALLALLVEAEVPGQ